jgi:hypothetical protein
MVLTAERNCREETDSYADLSTTDPTGNVPDCQADEGLTMAQHN